MSVYEFPPRLCLRSYVSLDSRYGTTFLPAFCPFDWLSVRVVMTLRRTWRDLLMSILSFACYPVVPVKLYFSEPAKSTSWSFETVTLTGSLKSCDSIVKLKMLCDRELKSLRL